MNHQKQVFKAVSALVAAEQAKSHDDAVKAIKQFAKATKKLAKARE
jgi:predicted TIM-barrel enzyme